jgi:CheY-like chemotaxis protein
MKKKLDSILLLDDNVATNYIHEKFIVEAECVHEVVAFQNGSDALDYLEENKNYLPDIIFVDINMPTMNAWEFFGHYNKIDDIDHHKPRIVLLSTSLSPKDEVKAKEISNISDIRIKPLTVEMIEDILQKHFPDNI